MNFSKIVSTRTAFLSETCVAPLSAMLFAGLIALAVVSTPASAQAVNFGNVNVCPAGKTTPAPCSAKQTVTFNIPAGTTIGSVAIVTTGIADLDFKAEADDTGTTLCKARTYSSATTCTVDVTFVPLAAGLRNGAVELLEGKTVLAMNYVSGTGVSPVAAFSPWLRTTIDTESNGVSGASGVALDARGNIFVTNENAGTVKEILAESGYTTFKNLGGGFINPVGVAVDGAGNVIVANLGTLGSTSTSAVKMIPASCIDGSNDTSCVKTLGGGFHYPRSVAVDGTGSVFVTDAKHFYVKEIPASCIAGENNASCILEWDVLPYSLSAITVDAIGNVFFAGPNYLYEILAVNGSIPPNPTFKVLNNTLTSDPEGIAVDASGNVFIADFFDGAYEFSASGGYASSEIIFPAVNTVQGVAVDASGNIFLASQYERQLDVLQRSLPPALTFASTNVGSTSSDSPKSATLQNVGNATLVGFPSLTDTTNFGLVAGSDTSLDCGGSFSLAPSAQCNVNVDFTPQTAELITSKLVLTDNAGNQSDATQSIDLSGSGGGQALAQVTPTSLQFGSMPYPTTATQPITITNIGVGTLTVNPSSNGPSTVITGNTCGAGIGAGKSCTLQVEVKPVRLGYIRNTVTIATNSGVNPTVPVLGVATGVGSPVNALDFYVLGRGNTTTGWLEVENYGIPGSVTVTTSTGAVSFKVIDNSCVNGVSLNGSCAIGIEYTPTTQGTQTAYLKLIPGTGPVQIIRLTGTLTTK